MRMFHFDEDFIRTQPWQHRPFLRVILKCRRDSMLVDAALCQWERGDISDDIALLALTAALANQNAQLMTVLNKRAVLEPMNITVTREEFEQIKKSIAHAG